MCQTKQVGQNMDHWVTFQEDFHNMTDVTNSKVLKNHKKHAARNAGKGCEQTTMLTTRERIFLPFSLSFPLSLSLSFPPLLKNTSEAINLLTPVICFHLDRDEPPPRIRS
jgi:hypothetical protein